MLRVSVFCVMFSAFCNVAWASIASTKYVTEIVNSLVFQADWNQTDENAMGYIKNKPIIPDENTLEHISNKVNVISADAKEGAYPTVNAVSTALSARALVDDVRFDTISTSRPDGTPPTGQVFIWVN